MKVLIVSDTHGYDDNMWTAIHREEPIDMLIHCGDIEHMPAELEKYLHCPVHVVAGNNDFMFKLPEMKRIDLCGHDVLVLHGHHYNIYREQSALFYLAEDNQAEIVMFGHLHVPMVQTEGDITIVNPGSMTYPRQEGGKPSYIVMTVTDEDEPEYEIKYI